MKARHEFETLNEYKDYLKAYYAGKMFPAVYTDHVTWTDTDMAKQARNLANLLVKNLNLEENEQIRMG